MHDVDNHIAPKKIVTLFKKVKVRSVHSYKTRSVSSDKFYSDYMHARQQNSLSRFEARIWNSTSSNHPQSAKVII